MGLAGPKKRSKIAHDPNNNNWAKSTNSFGHKILASQGWKPGDTLGARDANHAAHYTVGSNSHIRVLLKDDNLGLGAARGGNNAETFGLSLYSGLLGRLNGKSEAEVEKQQTAQRDVELALYQGRKYGNINFISAGFLVGDKIELKSTVMPNSKLASKQAAPAVANNASDDAGSSKKRKRSEVETPKDNSSDSDSSDSSSDDIEEPPKSKKTKESKKEKKSKKSSTKESSSESTDESKSKERRKKEKKDKKRKVAEGTSSEDETRAERKARKAERRAKKEEKRRKKEEKRASKSATATPSSTTPGTPSESAQPSPAAALFGRQAVRQRYIAQKRMAHLDPQALKEVCFPKFLESENETNSRGRFSWSRHREICITFHHSSIHMRGQHGVLESHMQRVLQQVLDKSGHKHFIPSFSIRATTYQSHNPKMLYSSHNSTEARFYN